MKWSATLPRDPSATRSFQGAAECGKPGGRFRGRGKSGGVRVIHYFAAPDAVYFIAVYAKNEKENISDAEKKALAKILRPIKRQEH
jgi:hypothetical protein